MISGIIANLFVIVATLFGLLQDMRVDLSPIINDPTGDNLALNSASLVNQDSIFITDISQLSTAPIDDPSSLWAIQLELLAIAEAMYGPRDLSKIVYQPKFRSDGPRVRHTLDLSGAYAELSPKAQQHWRFVVFQMAHETVHLLNPVFLGEATYLEEGVAVAFSYFVQPMYGIDIVNNLPSYTYARELVAALPNGHLSAGRIRQELGSLSHVTPDDLIRLFPALDARIANELSCKFNRDAVPSDSDTSC